MAATWRSLVRPTPGAARIGGSLGLAVALLFLLSGRDVDLLGSTGRIGLVLLWPLALVATWKSGRVWPAWAYLVGAGLVLRIADFPAGGGGPSDVQAATHEAIAVLLGGGNPYDHVYQQTRPPGSPMPYPPGALLLHLPGYLIEGMVGVQLTQVLFAGVTMATLVWLGARVSWLVALPALAAYATAPNLVILSVDGSNDTGAGAMLGLALVAVMLALDRGPTLPALIAAGVAGGLAIATKQTSLPVLVVVAVFLGQVHGRRALAGYATGAVVLLLAVSVPFLLMDAGAYLTRLASFVGVHDDVYGWNIWTFARGMGWPVWESGPAAVLNLLATGAALAVAVVVRYRGLAGAAAAGLVVTLVLLLTARWTTYAYFALVVPIALILPLLAGWQARPARQGPSARQGPPAVVPAESQAPPAGG